MPKLSMDVPHTLGRDEAQRRLKDKFTAAKTAYQSKVTDLEEHWDDHTLTFGFKAMGMKVAGTLAVEDQAIRVNADLPMAASLFKGVIEQRTREELTQILG